MTMIEKKTVVRTNHDERGEHEVLSWRTNKSEYGVAIEVPYYNVKSLGDLLAITQATLHIIKYNKNILLGCSIDGVTTEVAIDVVTAELDALESAMVAQATAKAEAGKLDPDPSRNGRAPVAATK